MEKTVAQKTAAKERSCSSCEPLVARKGGARNAQEAAHPDHSAAKARLNRVKGQLDAVSRMIGEQAYCPNILQQLRAASSALRGLETEILRGHLRGCVATAFQSRNPFESNDKIEEILE